MPDRNSLSPMDVLTRPRWVLSLVTLAVAAGMAVWAFALHNGTLPPSMLLLVGMAVLGLVGGSQRGALRGWAFLLAGWCVGIVAYGALFPG